MHEAHHHQCHELHFDPWQVGMYEDYTNSVDFVLAQSPIYRLNGGGASSNCSKLGNMEESIVVYVVVVSSLDSTKSRSSLASSPGPIPSFSMLHAERNPALTAGMGLYDRKYGNGYQLDPIPRSLASHIVKGKVTKNGFDSLISW